MAAHASDRLVCGKPDRSHPLDSCYRAESVPGDAEIRLSRQKHMHTRVGKATNIERRIWYFCLTLETSEIGHTTRSIDIRLMEWAEGCNRKATILYPVEPDQSVRVPNARRIEALCHAELAESRVIMYCHGCLKQHTEWFEVAFDKVKEVIQRWTQWMTTQHEERDSMGRIALGSKWKHGSVDGRKFVPQVNRRPRGSKAPPTQLAMDDLTTHLDSLHVTEACLTPAASPRRDGITTVTADRHHSVHISQRILDEAKPITTRPRLRLLTDKE